MKKEITTLFLFALLFICYLSSCKKLVEVGTPINQLTTATVFSDSTTAQSALLNIYALYTNTIDGVYNPNIALYSDELNYSNSAVQTAEFFHSSVSTTNSSDLTIWANYYYIIYSCNDLINQLSNSGKLPTSIVIQYTSEAKFLRAYAYFYLTNLYGAVPLVLATDINTTVNASRTDSVNVYKQIIKDLTDAQSGLSVSYPNGEKVRANQLTASALLARVYLYQRNWSSAENEASLVINSGIYTPLEPPGNVFLANSTETILQFETQNGFTSSGPILIPRSGKPIYPLSAVFLNTFEAGDTRLAIWTKANTVSGIKYYYPFKYHNRAANTSAPENLMALRAGEMYLIRAEARNMQNNISGAQSDLNVIRSRAGLANTTAGTTPTLNIAILHERQVELFSEWGHRFLDLKRTGQANVILGTYKTTWKPNISLLLPIPQHEVSHDLNLTQNPGY